MAKRNQTITPPPDEPAPRRNYRFTEMGGAAVAVEWIGDEFPTRDEIAAVAQFSAGDAVLVPVGSKCHPALITRVGVRLIATSPLVVYAPKYTLAIDPDSPLAIYAAGGILEAELLEHNRPTSPEKAMNLMLSTWREKHLRKGQKA